MYFSEEITWYVDCPLISKDVAVEKRLLCFSLGILPKHERPNQLKRFSDSCWLHGLFLDQKARRKYFHAQV